MADDKKKGADQAAVDVGEIVKQTLETVLPAAIAAAAQASKPAQAAAGPVNPYARQFLDPTRCDKCGQLLVACKNEHRMAVLWPDDEEAAQWYDGVIINGVRYKSPYPGVPVVVPKAFDGEHITQVYTKNERELRRGKTRTRMSGAIGPSGTNVTPLGPKDYLR